MARLWGVKAIKVSPEEERATELAVERLNLSDDESVQTITDRLSATLGKPIILQDASEVGLSKLTGAALEFEDHFLIFYRAIDSQPYQVHSIFHEYGHLLSGNKGCEIDFHADTARSIEKILLRNPAERISEAIAYELSGHLLRKPLKNRAFG